MSGKKYASRVAKAQTKIQERLRGSVEFSRTITYVLLPLQLLSTAAVELPRLSIHQMLPSFLAHSS
jgi:hypothetical protein